MSPSLTKTELKSALRALLFLLLLCAGFGTALLLAYKGVVILAGGL